MRHKYFGFVGLGVLIFWTLGSFMRPLMTEWLEPNIAYHQVPAKPLDPGRVQKSLHEILAQHNIKGFRNFRYVEMNGKYYYQLKNTFNHLLYFDAVTGEQLAHGDQVYAEYLARYFADDRHASAKVSFIKDFNNQYIKANRLLPVYRVIFDRQDGLEVYIETMQSRLAAYHTYGMKAFHWVFGSFGNTPVVEAKYTFALPGKVTLVFLLIIFTVSISGMIIYGWRWKKFRPASGSEKASGLRRKLQRPMGMFASVTMFCFVLSIASYMLSNLIPEDIYYDDENSIFGIADIQIETAELPWHETKAYNASVVRMPQGIFYQLFGYDEHKQPHTYYIHASTGEFLPDGDFIYARYLANKFKNFKTKIDAGVSFSCCLPQDTIPDGTQIRKAGIIATEFITRFDSSYQATHKRLPVIKVTYEKPENTSFYIETSSSSLAALIENPKQKNKSETSYMAQMMIWLRQTGSVKWVNFVLLTISLLGTLLFLKIK